jgi:hypothetical protein
MVRPHDTRTRGLVRLGVFGAVVTLVSMGLVAILAVPPFLELDETGHVAYGVAVSEGRLPNVTEPAETHMPGQRTYVQRHGGQPPLYYTLAAPVLGWGVDSGHWRASVRAARAMSLVYTSITLAATAAIAGVLVRRRRAETMVLAAGLAGTVYVLVSVSSFVRNDALSVTGAALAVLGGFASLADGPRPRFILLACLGSAVAMATRFNTFAVVGIVALCLAAAAWFHIDGSRWTRLWRSLLLGGLPVATVAATSGWFYWRSYRLYGDITGLEPLVDLIGGRPEARYTVVEWLLEPTAVPTIFLQAQGGGGWGRNWYSFNEDLIMIIAVGLVAVGGVLSSLSRRPATRAASAATSPARLILIVAAVALPLISWYQLSIWVSYGGRPIVRYLAVVIPIIAVGVAAACLGYRGRWGRLVGIGLVGLQTVVAVLGWGRWMVFRSGGEMGDTAIETLLEGMERGGIPVPPLVLTVLALGAAAGIALQAWALWRIGGLAEAGPVREAARGQTRLAGKTVTGNGWIMSDLSPAAGRPSGGEG